MQFSGSPDAGLSPSPYMVLIQPLGRGRGSAERPPPSPRRACPLRFPATSALHPEQKVKAAPRSTSLCLWKEHSSCFFSGSPLPGGALPSGMWENRDPTGTFSSVTALAVGVGREHEERTVTCSSPVALDCFELEAVPGPHPGMGQSSVFADLSWSLGCALVSTLS